MLNKSNSIKKVRFEGVKSQESIISCTFSLSSSDSSDFLDSSCENLSCDLTSEFCENTNVPIENNASAEEFSENKSVDKSRNCIVLDEFLKGLSKRFRLLFLVWTLVSLQLASAKPSIFDFDFDIFGRSYDPFSCGCSGGGSKRARVVGGTELPEGSAPWLVAITKNGRSHCGSTLISPEHLLTAAHCIDGVSTDELYAWLGIYSISEAQSLSSGVGIRRAYQHPHFQRNGFFNDIAVLALQNTVQFSDTVRPICLPSKDNADYAGRTALVAGWGKTAESEPPSDTPRQAYIQVWSKSKCRGSGYPAKRVSGEVLCAGLSRGGVDACQGDSGGPLIMEASHGGMEIIGVVSWGRGCARPNLPGVYTRVASYLDFIHDIIDDSCS